MTDRLLIASTLSQIVLPPIWYDPGTNNSFSIPFSEQKWGRVNNQVDYPLPGDKLSVSFFFSSGCSLSFLWYFRGHIGCRE